MSQRSTGFVLVISIIAINLGCRSTPTASCERAVALLRAEIIDLENKYYELQGRHQAMLEDGYPDPWSDPSDSPNRRIEPPAWRNGPNRSRQPGTAPADESSDPGDFEELPEQLIIEGDDVSQGIPYQGIPHQGIPHQGIPHQGIPTRESLGPSVRFPSPQDETGNLESPKTTVAAAMPRAVTEAKRHLQTHVVELALDCDVQGTRERNSWLIVQPLDEQNNALPLAGQLKFTILAPQPTGGQRQVGRWQLSADQVAQLVRDSQTDIPGIHLPLPAIINRNETAGMVGLIEYALGDGRVFKSTFALDGAFAPVASTTQRQAITRPHKGFDATPASLPNEPPLLRQARRDRTINRPKRSTPDPVLPDLVPPTNAEATAQADGWSPDR